MDSFKRLAHQLYNRVYTSAGLYRLAAGFGFFALIHLCFLIFTSLQGVFINTLLIRLTENNDIVMFYNLVLFLFSGPMMLAASQVARRTSPGAMMKVGILLHILMYLTFFLTMDHLAYTMPLIAALAGTGNGFYWFSYSYLINVFSTDESRDLAVALIGIIAGVVSLSMPAVAGVVIGRFQGLTGYVVMFGFSLAMAVVTILLTRRMKPVEPGERKSQLRSLLRAVRRDRLYGWAFAGEYVRCLREGVFGFLFNVLLFTAVKSEAAVGLNTLLAGVASILGAMAYGRLVTGKTRIRSMAVSCTMLLALAVPMFFSLSPFMIILYSTLNAVLGVFLMNPTFSLSYALVLGEPGTRPAMPEFIGLRECVISFGRMSGIAFMLLLPRTTAGYVSAIVALTALQYVMTLMFRRVARATARRESAPEPGEAKSGEREGAAE